MRTTLVPRVLCTAALLACTSLAHAGLPDLRNLSYDYMGKLVLGGTVPGFGVQSLTFTFSGVPFSIVPDSNFPNDPSHITINTQLPAPALPTNPAANLAISLTGTYNQTTGALTATGSRPGFVFSDSGIVDNNVLLNSHLEIWTALVNPTLTLDGIVSVGNNLITITGTDALPGKAGPSTNLTLAAAAVLLVPPGDPNPNDALVTIPVQDAFAGIAWKATAPLPVPEPGTLALLIGLSSTGLLALRRRK